MFDIAPSEFLLVAVVALLVIGPKDLPKAMRFLGYWVGKARGVMGQVRSGFDSMVREAELHDMEKKWAAENERIMREHATPAALASDVPGDASGAVVEHVAQDAPPMMVEQPLMVENPVVIAASDGASEAIAPTAPKPRKPRAKKTEPKAES